MKLLPLLLPVLLLSACSSPSRLTPADLDTLTGPPFSGTLTYLDYSTSKPTSIASTLSVSRLPPPTSQPSWLVATGYPKEPNENATETLKLSPDGRTLGDETVTLISRRHDGTLYFVTESTGPDNDRPAHFRFEHTLTPTSYTRRKLVRYDTEPTYFERHTYHWTRPPKQ